MLSMNTIGEVLKYVKQEKESFPQTPFKEKELKPIANSLLVDNLLRDYEDLIIPTYTKWFAKRFYRLPFDQIHRAASEARQEGKDARKLFSFLINKAYSKSMLT